MISRLLVLIVLPVMAYYLVKSARTRFNLNSRQTQILFAIVAALLVVAVLILMGRLPIQFIFAPITAAVAFLLRFLPTLMRLLPLWQMFQSRTTRAQPRSSEQTSTIRTEFLEMELEHSSGNMDGLVLKGEHREKKLSDMALPALLELHQECVIDSDSLQVLEAYLDRVHEEWRDQNTGSNNSIEIDETRMTQDLALEILGLEVGASEEEIIKAHRTLMQKLHPDRGGSDYLAKKINLAKDHLLD